MKTSSAPDCIVSQSRAEGKQSVAKYFLGLFFRSIRDSPVNDTSASVRRLTNGPQSDWIAKAGSKVRRELNHVTVVIGPDEFALVGGRAAISSRSTPVENNPREQGDGLGPDGHQRCRDASLLEQPPLEPVLEKLALPFHLMPYSIR